MTRLRSAIGPLDAIAPIPTSRTWGLLITAFLLYVFGNQTQVGWLYVTSALLAGTVLASWWLNRRALQGIAVERQVGDASDAELYEGDSVLVRLTVRNTGHAIAAHIRTAERCPLVAPESPRREMHLFVPSIPARGGAAQFEYDVTLYRRGLHEFPPLDLTSRAPFGFFRRRRRIVAPTRVLVYPEVQPLRRLSLLDHRLALEIAHPRPGRGTEILGVRPFRSGDSPRHIHWRSVARTGRLISKEFVDESRPGLALVLDAYRHPYPLTESKHTPFEWAVKVAASIGDYAQRCGYPLHLLADEAALPVPTGPLARLALLEWLARVQPIGERKLAEVLDRGVATFCPCVVAVLPWPDRAALEPLIALHRWGLAVFVVCLDPASFPHGGPRAGSLSDDARGSGLETCLIRFGTDWREQFDPWRASLPVNAYAHRESPQ